MNGMTPPCWISARIPICTSWAVTTCVVEIDINRSHPLTGGPGTRERSDPTSLFLSRSHFSHPVTILNFLSWISPLILCLPNVLCFDMFVKNPKGSTPEVVQGVHKFLPNVTVGKEQGPTNSVFIGGYSASSPQFR